MKVKIKKIDEKAVVPFKTYEDDFCYDVVATSCEKVAPNIYKYGIGLAFEIDRNQSLPMMFHLVTNENRALEQHYFSMILDIDFRPRSSVWKTGMILSNCEGTIDELFRGEVSAVFYHVFPNMPKYEIGDKIGQIKLGMTLPMEFEEVEELSETDRGTGSYGSTGK